MRRKGYCDFKYAPFGTTCKVFLKVGISGQMGLVHERRLPGNVESRWFPDTLRLHWTRLSPSSLSVILTRRT